MQRADLLVSGGGVEGSSAARVLSRAGARVTVLDASGGRGGRERVLLQRDALAHGAALRNGSGATVAASVRSCLAAAAAVLARR